MEDALRYLVTQQEGRRGKKSFGIKISLRSDEASRRTSVDERDPKEGVRWPARPQSISSLMGLPHLRVIQ